MRLFVTTQSYVYKTPTPYGLLLELDTVTGQVARTTRIETPVDTGIDPSARIKPGLRGIYAYGGRLYVATWNRVVVLDAASMAVVDEVSHAWMADLHGLYVDEHGIWVTSSLPDVVALYDFDGTPRSSIWMMETSLYETPVVHDRAMDWRNRGKKYLGSLAVHANHVNVFGGYVYITAKGQKHARGGMGRVIRVPVQAFLDRAEVREQDLEVWSSGLHGPHDGVVVGRHYVVTETSGATCAALDLETGRLVARGKVMAPGERVTYEGVSDWARHLVRERLLGRAGKRTTHWTRGLAAAGGALFVGQSTYEGDTESYARIVELGPDLRGRREFSLEVDGYPELRIFQVYAGGDQNVPGQPLAAGAAGRRLLGRRR